MGLNLTGVEKAELEGIVSRMKSQFGKTFEHPVYTREDGLVQAYDFPDETSQKDFIKECEKEGMEYATRI